MILDGFIRFHCHDDEAQGDLAELLDEDVADDLQACDAVASGDFLGGVNAVFIEPGPGLAIEEVEEAGVEPVGYYWQGEGKVFIRDEGEERRTQLRRCRGRVHFLYEAKPGGNERMTALGQMEFVVVKGLLLCPLPEEDGGVNSSTPWNVELGGNLGKTIFSWCDPFSNFRWM